MNDYQMRQAIMNQIICTGNGVASDTWFALIFATTATLRKICKDLGIAA